jgi:hypothetical protein
MCRVGGGRWLLASTASAQRRRGRKNRSSGNLLIDTSQSSVGVGWITLLPSLREKHSNLVLRSQPDLLEDRAPREEGVRVGLNFHELGVQVMAVERHPVDELAGAHQLRRARVDGDLVGPRPLEEERPCRLLAPISLCPERRSDPQQDARTYPAGIQ